MSPSGINVATGTVASLLGSRYVGLTNANGLRQIEVDTFYADTQVTLGLREQLNFRAGRLANNGTASIYKSKGAVTLHRK